MHLAGAMFIGHARPLSSWCVSAMQQAHAHANAIAAHPHRHCLAILVEHLEVERLRILETELEHLTNLHTTLEAERA